MASTRPQFQETKYVREIGNAIDADILKTLPTITPPDTLNHYTTADGLLGIVSSGVLKASDCRYVPDPLDGVMPLSIFRDLMRSPSDEWIKKLAPHIDLHAESDAESPGMIGSRLFTVSFSEYDDDLSQWRAYADDGTGFVLGFDAKRLMEVARFGRLVKVSYAKEDVRKTVEAIIAAYQVEYEKPRERSPVFDRRFARGIYESLLHVGPFFKDGAYAPEAEWRWYSLSGFGAKAVIHSRRGVLYPCLNVPISTPESHALASIVVGPSSRPTPALASAAVMDLLQGTNIRQWSLASSSIQYVSRR